MRDFERETGATGATGYSLAAAEGDADDTYGSAATLGYSMAAAPQSRPGVGYDMAVAGDGNGDDLYNQSYTQAVATVPDSVDGVVVQLVDAKAKTSLDNAANLMLPGQALAVGNDNYADYQAGGRNQVVDQVLPQWKECSLKMQFFGSDPTLTTTLWATMGRPVPGRRSLGQRPMYERRRPFSLLNDGRTM